MTYILHRALDDRYSLQNKKGHGTGTSLGDPIEIGAYKKAENHNLEISVKMIEHGEFHPPTGHFHREI